MREMRYGFYLIGSIVLASILSAAGCQPPATNTSTVTNTATVNTNVNRNTNVATTSSTTITTSEPDQYQANIKMTLETTGDTQKATLPTIGAMVARSGADRVMEFVLPGTGEKIIYLDKGGMNYVILPNRKQYAELTKEALGFEVRRLLMPEQIVTQVKALPGVRLVGEETLNGRPVVKYAYSGTANTQTQAGTVATESFVLVDKETGLPVRSEVLSQAQGGSVQGISGARIVTEMTDIKTTPDSTVFTLPSDYQKIDSEQVKAQANLIFSTVAAVVGQAVKQAQAPAPSPTASPTK